MARCTPRSCSAWRASPGAARPALPPDAADPDAARSSPLATSAGGRSDDGPHRHRLVKTGGSRAKRRRRQRPHPALLQPRRAMGVIRPADALPPRPLLPQRRGRRAALLPRGQRHASRATSGRCAMAPATTWSSRSARPGGSTPDRREHRVLYLESPTEIVRAAALPQRLRAAARALAVLATATSAPRTRRRRTPSAGDFDDPRQGARQGHRLPLPAPPLRRGRLGRLPLPLHLQHRRLRADHRARPPAAAGAPDLRGAQLRRLQLRAAQVRLPPAFDPGALQPLQHQQRRGHLLRGRQLHEPPRRGHQLVHGASRRHPARAASGHGRGDHRQGSDRGARGDGRHVPSAAPHDPGQRHGGRPLPVRWLPPEDAGDPARELSERGPEAFPD